MKERAELLGPPLFVAKNFWNRPASERGHAMIYQQPG
jgi:hypothetical protein